MDDEDIRRLIVDLRAMMAETGFGWAVDQAEACLPIDTHPYWRARALIDAAEAVTVDLAEAEIRATQSLEVREITFALDVADGDDGDGAGDGAGPRLGQRGLTAEQGDGWQRAGVLAELASQRGKFRELRDLLDVGR